MRCKGSLGQRSNKPSPKSWYSVFFVLAHIPLGLLIHSYPTLATLHAFAALLLGLWWSISDSRSERVTYAAAYIVGAEVLWRMSDAVVVWEYGKYAIAAILIAA